MLNFFKKDYASVRTAVKMLTNDKAPDWAITVYYIVILPFGLLLTPLALLYARYLTWKFEKMISKN